MTDQPLIVAPTLKEMPVSLYAEKQRRYDGSERLEPRLKQNQLTEQKTNQNEMDIRKSN